MANPPKTKGSTKFLSISLPITLKAAPIVLTFPIRPNDLVSETPNAFAFSIAASLAFSKTSDIPLKPILDVNFEMPERVLPVRPILVLRFSENLSCFCSSCSYSWLYFKTCLYSLLSCLMFPTPLL